MTAQEHINFRRIAEAITYLQQNFRQQPSLDEVAEKIHLSSYHFQRLFTQWAGVSPKKFLQYISVEHAKSLLKTKQATLFNTAHQTGLSGTGRLHDLFVKIEGMTPGEYKDGGKSLEISYGFQESPFGSILIGSTTKGICHISFVASEDEASNQLQTQFPKASFCSQPLHSSVKQFFSQDWTNLDRIKLHLKGTDFQLKVWEALLKIPAGNLTTYGKLATCIGKPNASRAVGTAIGSNPIAYLIPCHRVIQSSGVFGGYRWGPARKTAMIGWEAAQAEQMPA